MKRSEHLQWAKDRASKLTRLTAWLSFVSDMQKRDEFGKHIAIDLGNMMFIQTGKKVSDSEVQKFIRGFN